MSRLHVHAWGDEAAPPVVCLHGVTGSGRHFEQLAGRLTPAHRVLAPDLLGHGDSPREPPWRLADHLDAVEASVGARRRLARALVRRADRLRARRATSRHRRAPRPPRPGDPASAARRPLGGRERAPRAGLRELRGSDRPSLRGEPAPRRSARARRGRAPRPHGRERGRLALPLHAGVRRDGLQRDGDAHRRRSPTSASRRSSCSAPSRTCPTTTCSTRTERRSETSSRSNGPGGHTVLWDALDETADAIAGFLARAAVGCLSRGGGRPQLTYSSAIASVSSRIATPASTSSRVIVSGGTTMTTFQCVIR